MAQRKGSSVSSTLWIIIAFIIGALFGLVVLGWWVWPVTWTGGSPETLDAVAQQDYLRAAIDSHTLSQDAELATTRYESLGENRQAILGEIYNSPEPQTEQEIADFAAAVGADEVSAGPVVTEAPQSETMPLGGLLTNRPTWMTLCLAGLLVFLVFLLIVLILIRGRNKRKASASVAPTVTTYDSSRDIHEGSEIKSQTGTEIPASDTQPNYLTQGSAPPSGIEEGELPAWLIESAAAESKGKSASQVETKPIELSDEQIDEISASIFPFIPEGVQPGQVETATGATMPSPFLGGTGESKSPETRTDTMAGAAQPDEAPHFPGTTVPAGAAPAQIFEETPEQTHQKFSADIQSIPDMEASESEKLRQAGITAPLLLLKNGASLQGRESIAQQTGIDYYKILSWVNFVDLLRIKGLTHEDALMLKEAGVNMMVELAARDPKMLHERLLIIKGEGNAIPSAPTVEQIEGWIKQANQLPPAVTY